MFRNALFLVTLVVATLITGAMAIAGAYLDRSGGLGRRATILFGRMLLWAAGVEVEADLRWLPRTRSAIFLATHQSHLDIPILFRLLGPKYVFGFVAKESLFRFPVFGQAMRAIGCVPIDRSNQRKAMRSIDQAVKLVRAGRSIALFPEGTRSTDFNTLGDFKIGGLILALKAQAPVSPIIIMGTGEILPKSRPSLAPGRRKVVVKALPPVILGDRYSLKNREQFKNDLYDIMHTAYQEIRECRQRTM